MARIISAIVACDVNGGIGKDGKIPWYDRDETLWFKGITMGKPCIMGRNTYDSLPAPLKGRRNIVVSSWFDSDEEGVEVARSPFTALSMCAAEPEVMVCGGAEIYKALMPEVDRVYMSIIPTSLECDTFFEEPPVDEFTIVGEIQHTTFDTFVYMRNK